MKTRVAVLLAWLFLGGYVGVGGWARAELAQETQLLGADTTKAVAYHGVQYKNAKELERLLQEQNAYRWFPWIFYTPPLFGLVIMCLGWGAVGGVIRITHSVMKNTPLTSLPVFAAPTLGALVGLMLLGTAYVLPVALAAGDTSLRPSTMLFLSILGGAFADDAYDWIASQVKKLFATRE